MPPKTTSKPGTPKSAAAKPKPKPPSKSGSSVKDSKKSKTPKGEEKTAEQLEQERVLRNSIDHEAKIREQIAQLTGKVRSSIHANVIFQLIGSLKG